MNNIKEMEEFVDTVYLNFNKNENNLRPISLVWNTIVFKLLGGKADPRELMELVVNHEM